MTRISMAAVSLSLLVIAPATPVYADGVEHVQVFDKDGTWTVPVEATDISYEASGGAGGTDDARLTRAGGRAALVTGPLRLVGGQSAEIRVGLQGTASYSTGLGGAGFKQGGAGAPSQWLEFPRAVGAGGGGSSAIVVNGEPVVIAGGGGGSGAAEPRPPGPHFRPSCDSGRGGDAGAPGSDSSSIAEKLRCASNSGGKAGAQENAGASGGNGDTSRNLRVQSLGAGGGGAGGGQGGQNDAHSCFSDPCIAAGAGGGGGASIGDTVGIAPERGNGRVVLRWKDRTIRTTLSAIANPNPVKIGQQTSFFVDVISTSGAPAGTVKITWDGGSSSAPLVAVGSSASKAVVKVTAGSSIGGKTYHVGYQPAADTPFLPSNTSVNLSIVP